MATESTTTSTTSSTRTLKVSCGDDTRRLAVTFPAEATSEQRFALIENIVRYGFELGDAASDSLLLHYLDDEGDKCTLQAATVNDLFSLYPQGPIKLQMQRRITKPAEETEGSKAGLEGSATAAEGVAGEEASPSMPNLQHLAGMGDRLMANFTMGVILPMAAQSASSPERRAASNEAGLHKREALLPLAMQLLEHAERIPESRGVKGPMEQFVDGSDPAHFGDACADILQAWSLSSSKQEVHESFKACVGAMMKVLPAMKQHCHARSESSSKEQSECAQAEPKEDGQYDQECDVDIDRVKAAPVADAVADEAAPAAGAELLSSEPSGQRTCHVQMMLPWLAAAADWHRDANNEAGLLHQDELLPLALQLLKHVERVPESRHLKPAMQQYVDGSDPAHFGDTCADILQAWAQSASKQEAEESFQACFVPFKASHHGLFGKGEGKGKCKGKGKGKGKCKGESKGFGKGMKGLRCWWWQRSAEKRAEEAAAAAAAAATAAEQGAEGPFGGTVAEEKAEEAPTEQEKADMTDSDMQSKVEKLLEMGLVMDPEVAKEMLLAHGGDTAAVAALLMS